MSILWTLRNSTRGKTQPSGSYVKDHTRIIFGGKDQALRPIMVQVQDAPAFGIITNWDFRLRFAIQTGVSLPFSRMLRHPLLKIINR
jgi:hypothetical protein